ncbi:MAG: 4-hydroxy-tetrahydrodipicolinate reductase [Erysipelotrichaceae bacterium]|nr:4-hydroxy-tetrahydrodipicolinate reductase [Erysipelotrichaceae bacterium]MCI9312661.1 4-hydroxy-tetrahydrodipicolinate reductase [Erysipelotrichaceae bacterium]
MIHVALNGYGQMGKRLHQAIAASADMECVLVVNRFQEEELYHLTQPVDLIIDFSHRDSLDIALRYAKYSGCALLSGTTGLSYDQYDAMYELAQEVPLMYAHNYAFGIAAMLKAVEAILPDVKDTFDVRLMEMHHARKQDAPSGTALAILETLYTQIHPDAISVHSLRGGTVAGEHTLLFLGNEEILEIKHTALNRSIFVNGALRCARWLIQQPNGFYTPKDMIGEI